MIEEKENRKEGEGEGKDDDWHSEATQDRACSSKNSICHDSLLSYISLIKAHLHPIYMYTYMPEVVILL